MACVYGNLRMDMVNTQKGIDVQSHLLLLSMTADYKFNKRLGKNLDLKRYWPSFCFICFYANNMTVLTSKQESWVSLNCIIMILLTFTRITYLIKLKVTLTKTVNGIIDCSVAKSSLKSLNWENTIKMLVPVDQKPTKVGV